MKRTLLLAGTAAVAAAAVLALTWPARTAPRGDPGIEFLDKARWSDTPPISKEAVRQRCRRQPSPCAHSQRPGSTLRLVRYGNKPVWALIGPPGPGRFVTLFDQAGTAARPERLGHEHPPWGPGAVVGIDYIHSVNAHCGVRYTAFDGRGWITDSPLGGNNTPPGWGDGGWPVSTLVEPDVLVHRSGPYTVRFRPFGPDDPPAPVCG